MNTLEKPWDLKSKGLSLSSDLELKTREAVLTSLELFPPVVLEVESINVCASALHILISYIPVSLNFFSKIFF